MVLEADYVADFSISNGTDGDAVRLVDCEDALVDTVVYGTENDDLMTDDNGDIADPVPNPGSDRTVPSACALTRACNNPARIQ